MNSNRLVKGNFPGAIRVPAFLLSVSLLAGVALADQVVMKNGDHYLGKVICLTNETLIFHSDNLGKLSLSRPQIGSITFGNAAKPGVQTAKTNTALKQPRTAAADTLSPAELAAGLPKVQAGKNSQAYSELLSQAGPEATRQFNEMVRGLMTGKLNVDDIRKQAKATADQVRALRSEFGDEEGGAIIDSYLAILDSFLKDSEVADR